MGNVLKLNAKLKELEIYPEKNSNGNYEVGRYYWKGQEEDGEIWHCEFETSSYSNAIFLTHINKLYRLTDFILYPDDYIETGQLSLMLVEKAARKIRDDLDRDAGDVTIELLDECFKRR